MLSTIAAVSAAVTLALPLFAALTRLLRSPYGHDAFLKDWNDLKGTMAKIAAAMPEDKFKFKPTDPQRPVDVGRGGDGHGPGARAGNGRRRSAGPSPARRPT